MSNDSSVKEQQLASKLEKNNKVYSRYKDRAKALFSKTDYTNAAAYCQMAANFAWKSHCGLFSDPEIESLLRQIGEKTLEEHNQPTPISSFSALKKVLHVMTQAYETGGHTRLVWRWIAFDTSRVHSVFLTNQNDLKIPNKLQKAVEKSGGYIQCVHRPNTNLVKKAEELRQFILSQGIELIVLHIHPYDVVPNIAFIGTFESMPVTFMNHADHVFWVGGSVSNLIANIRRSGEQLCFSRRGIGFDDSVLLPLPLDKPDLSTSKETARRAIGIDSDSTMVLTIASSYKFRAVGENDFRTIVLPFVKRFKKLELTIVGPSEDEKYWREARKLSGGKIRVLGSRKDISVFYRAADIYLDSMPVSSFTSLLEAASYGLPVLTFGKSDTSLKMDDPSIPAEIVIDKSLKDFEGLFEALIVDKDHREKLGSQLRKSISEYHLPESWVSLCENAYQKVSQKSRIELKTTNGFMERIDKGLLSVIDMGIWRSVASVSKEGLKLVTTGEKLRLTCELVIATARDPRNLRLFLPSNVKKAIKKIMRAGNGNFIDKRLPENENS